MKPARLLLPIALSLALLCGCSDEGPDGAAPDGSGSDGSVAVTCPEIIINEVMSGNDSYAPAADGGYYDWVELYNPGAQDADLTGWYLSDDASEPKQCSLAGLTVPAGGYAIVYCSGLGASAPGETHTSFRLSKSGESLVLTTPDGASETLALPEIADDMSYGLDGGGAYVLFTSPTPGAANSPAAEEIKHPDPAGVVINEYQTSNTYTVYDCESDYGDWLELYNPTAETADLSGYSLSDSGSPGEWAFPGGTALAPGEYLLVWCDGKDRTDAEGALHTSFSLSGNDELLALYAPWGELVSSIAVVNMPKNISCGLPAGGTEPKLFSRPTPGAENSTAYVELGSDVSPDINDGVYISEVLAASGTRGSWQTDYIEIYNSTSEGVALGGYTLAQTPGEAFFTFPELTLGAGEYLVVWCGAADGTDGLCADIGISTGGEEFYLADPGGRVCDAFSSGKQTEGVTSGRAAGLGRVFFAVPTPGAQNSAESYAGYAPMPTLSVGGGVVEAGTTVTITAPEGCCIRYTLSGYEPTESSYEYTGPIEITGNTVLRAACFKPGYLPSQCVTETYLVENPHDISIVSVSGPPYVFGELLEVEHASGEYPVHVEFFDERGVKTSEFDCGASAFGQFSRALPQKSIRFSLREIYGQNEVTYDYFPDNPHGQTTYSNFVLRSSGQDQVRARLRDEMIPAFVRGEIDIDYMEFRAVAVYINGGYWGLYYLREHLGSDYLEFRYDYEEGSFDLVKWQVYAQVGTMDEYYALERYCYQNDLTVQENYDYIRSQVDLDSLIDFWVVQTYFANSDSGNIRCHKSEDGKWRWMLYDLDWAFTQDDGSWTFNYIDLHLLDPDGHGSADFINIIIRRLLENEDFLDRFLTRYCYHIQNTFAPERTVPILEEMAAVIDSEMLLQYDRWGYPSYTQWKESYVPFLISCLEEKPAIAVEQLQSSFGLTDEEIGAYLEKTRGTLPE